MHSGVLGQHQQRQASCSDKQKAGMPVLETFDLYNPFSLYAEICKYYGTLKISAILNIDGKRIQANGFSGPILIHSRLTIGPSLVKASQWTL